MSDPAYEAISKAKRQEDGGNPKGAVETLENYLSADQYCTSARLELARLLIYKLDDRKGGIEHLNAILEAEPDNLDALKASTTVMMTDKRYRDVVNKDYLRIIELVLEHDDRRELAQVCAAYAVFLRRQMVDFEASAKYYEKAIECCPDMYEYHQDYAVLLLNDLKDYLKAKHELEEVLRLRPNSLSASKNYEILMKTRFDENGNLKKKGLMSRFRH